MSLPTRERELKLHLDDRGAEECRVAPYTGA